MLKISDNTTPLQTSTTMRIDSIDVLRGLVMILMALDHCRDFFHLYAFVYNPEDLNYTTPFVFFTRWITHFCAPVFTLLAGVSAFLHAHKNNLTKKEIAQFLLTRGFILILLEITITRFAWRFTIDYNSIGGLVIWALGWSMVFLAAIVFMPHRFIFWLGFLIVCFHNLLDNVHLTDNRIAHIIWAFLHEKKIVPITDSFGINILYPVLPMIGLISLGYWLGAWFTSEYKADIRQGMLRYTGLSIVCLFVIIRTMQLITEQYAYVFYEAPGDSDFYKIFKNLSYFLITSYGDPNPWALQENFTYTCIAFFNTTKYPMSLLYILMTIGPALIFLSYIENKKNILTKILLVYGRVPLFYYILHLFLIHTLAVLVAILTNLDKMNEIIESGNWIELSKNYGYNLPVVYLVWIVVVTILYLPCRWYAKIKTKKKYKWLSYL